MDELLFDVQNVTYGYGPVPALAGVNLQIAAGDRLALLGSNGSGKSTLLRLLNGLYFPQSGRVLFQGGDLDEHSLSHPGFHALFRGRVALLFQDPDIQLFNATVFDDIAFGPLQLGWDEAQLAVRVEEVMAKLEIGHLRDRAPYHLSGGEKQRVALATVLVLEPEVLLLDEPAAALDPRSRRQLLEILQSLPESTTTVIATHDLEEASELASTCCVLHRGAIAAQGPAPGILADEVLLGRANLTWPGR